MFYDERIELAKGKICRNSLIIALFMALMIGALRFAYITLRNYRFVSACFFVTIEIVVFLCSATVLAAGAIRAIFCQKDERFTAQQSAFYIKASYICINIVMICAAIVLPLMLIIYPLLGINWIMLVYDKFLLLLFFMIGNYVVYSFKKNDIYLNYDLMEDDHYYTGVWKNIGKLCMRVLCCFTVSVVADLLISLLLRHIMFHFIEMFVLYALVTVTLIGIYLLYSCLERASYNSERTVSKATVVSLLIAVLVYALYSALSMYFSAMLGSETDKLEAIAIMSEAMQSIWIFAVLMFLTYFVYEYQKKKPNKLLSAALLTIILSIALSRVFSEIQAFISIIIIESAVDSESRMLMMQTFSAFVNYITFAGCIANSVGLVLTVFALIKDRSIGKSHIISVLLLGVLWGVEIFIFTHATALIITYYHFFVNNFALLGFWAMILSVSANDKKSLDKTEPM